MSKISVDVRFRAGFLGLDEKRSCVVDFEGDCVDGRIVGFVHHVFDVVPGKRGNGMVGADGSRSYASRLLSSAGPEPEVEIRIADDTSEEGNVVSAADFEGAVRGLRDRYEATMWAHVAPGPVAYGTIATIRPHPFNILVQRRGAIFVRFGYSRLECDRDAYMEFVPPTFDENGEEIESGNILFHDEALSRTCEQTWGGSRSGYHHVPAGRFFAENVEGDWRGFYDLDAIDAVVARFRTVWGDLDAQMNIPARYLYRRSLAMKAAA